MFKTKDKDQIEQARNEAIQRAARLKKISLEQFSGWQDYCSLLQDYVEKIQRRKLKTLLDTVSDEELYQLKLLDHERWLIETFIMKIPFIFVTNLEKNLDTEKRKAEKT